MFQVSLKLKNFFNHNISCVPIFMSSRKRPQRSKKQRFTYIRKATQISWSETSLVNFPENEENYFREKKVKIFPILFRDLKSELLKKAAVDIVIM